MTMYSISWLLECLEYRHKKVVGWRYVVIQKGTAVLTLLARKN